MRFYTHPALQELTLERILYALSDPVRLAIVKKLYDVQQATCTELQGNRPKSSMSHHFRVLRDAGLLHTQCMGTTHINSLRQDELNLMFPGLLDAILRHCPAYSEPQNRT